MIEKIRLMRMRVFGKLLDEKELAYLAYQW